MLLLLFVFLETGSSTTVEQPLDCHAVFYEAVDLSEYYPSQPGKLLDLLRWKRDWTATGNPVQSCVVVLDSCETCSCPSPTRPILVQVLGWKEQCRHLSWLPAPPAPQPRLNGETPSDRSSMQRDSDSPSDLILPKEPMWLPGQSSSTETPTSTFTTTPTLITTTPIQHERQPVTSFPQTKSDATRSDEQPTEKFNIQLLDTPTGFTLEKSPEGPDEHEGAGSKEEMNEQPTEESNAQILSLETHTSFTHEESTEGSDESLFVSTSEETTMGSEEYDGTHSQEDIDALFHSLEDTKQVISAKQVPSPWREEYLPYEHSKPLQISSKHRNLAVDHDDLWIEAMSEPVKTSKVEMKENILSIHRSIASLDGSGEASAIKVTTSASEPVVLVLKTTSSTASTTTTTSTTTHSLEAPMEDEAPIGDEAHQPRTDAKAEVLKERMDGWRSKYFTILGFFVCFIIITIISILVLILKLKNVKERGAGGRGDTGGNTSPGPGIMCDEQAPLTPREPAPFQY